MHILTIAECLLAALQNIYTSRIGCHRVLRYLLAPPMLPAEYMRPTFDKVTQGITDSDVIAFLSYILTTWLESKVWSVDDLSVFGLTIRTNNDVEG
jgi:hypothetical protein